MTTKMLNVTKMGIMRTNSPKLRPKIQKWHLKWEKWKWGTFWKTLKRNPFVKFESCFLNWKKILMTHLCDIGSFFQIWDKRVLVLNECGASGKVFDDTCANCNTISRKCFKIVVSQGLKCAFYPEPSRGININLAGGQVLNVSGRWPSFSPDISWDQFGEFLLWPRIYGLGQWCERFGNWCPVF